MVENDYEEINLLTIKNLLIVPIIEEFIYRACIINLFIEANIFTPNQCVLILPLFFAVGK